MPGGVNACSTTGTRVQWVSWATIHCTESPRFPVRRLLLERVLKSNSESTSPKQAIAVIGLGCRYPGADSPSELWENILARRQAFRRMPDCRLPLDQYHDPDPAAPDKWDCTPRSSYRDQACSR